MKRRSLRAPNGRGGARAGQLVDSPNGRVNRALAIDASWLQLWRDQYTRHVPARMRDAFEADYRAWQQVKQNMAAMSIASLILPATGEMLDSWANKAADWAARFKQLGVPTTAPAPARPPERELAEQTKKIVWGVAAALLAVAGIYGLSKIPAARRRAAA